MSNGADEFDRAYSDGLVDGYKQGHADGYKQGQKDAQPERKTRWLEEALLDHVRFSVGPIVVQTADVAVVKHGAWKARNFHVLYCTNCEFDFDIMKCEFISEMKYCPHCGAKMEGEHETD